MMNVEYRMQKMPKSIFLNKNIKELDASQVIASLKKHSFRVRGFLVGGYRGNDFKTPP
ncbi:hypothetical protein ACLGDQ_03375 [Helicobacter pylori]